MIRVIHKAKLPVRFKCRTNTSGPTTGDQDHILSRFKMTVHVLSDSAFRRYQKEMGYVYFSPLLTLARVDFIGIVVRHVLIRTK